MGRMTIQGALPTGFFIDLVVVSLRRVAHDHFCNEAAEEQLHTDDHGGQCNVESRAVGEGEISRAQFANDEVNDRQ